MAGLDGHLVVRRCPGRTAFARPVPHLPTTLVAIAAGELLGSISLVVDDHAELTRYSPWLASLFVAPAARGRGIGTALLERMLAEARALGIARLYLFTEHQEDWYAALGWILVEHARLADGHVVSILSRQP